MIRNPVERDPQDRHPDENYPHIAEENDARLQPDPQLALSSGRASALQIWTVILAMVAVAGIVLYGLNQSPQSPQTAASPPPATTGGAPSSDQPSASGSNGEQEKAAPAPAPEQPAQEPSKPGPSDSAR